MLQAVNEGCLNGAAGVEVLTEHVGTALQLQMRRRPSRARLIHFEAFGRHDLDETM